MYSQAFIASTMYSTSTVRLYTDEVTEYSVETRSYCTSTVQVLVLVLVLYSERGNVTEYSTSTGTEYGGNLKTVLVNGYYSST